MRISDWSSDVCSSDLPSFYRLRVREDNLADIPDLGRPPLARMSPRERWKAVHHMAYGDIRTISLPLSVADTIARAEALARDRTSAVEGRSVSVRLDLGGRRIISKKQNNTTSIL